jgi:hypothetical protein
LKKESLSPTNLQRKLPQTKNQQKEQKQKKQETQKKVRAKEGGEGKRWVSSSDQGWPVL